MGNLLVVDGCTLKFVTTGVTGTIMILPASVLCNVVKCSGKKVYESISFTLTGVNMTGITSGTGAGVILGGSTKTHSKGLPFVLDSDTVTVTVTSSVGSPPPTAPVEIGIDNAGQSRAKAV